MPLFTTAIRSVRWHTRNNSTSHIYRYSSLSPAAASRMKVHPEVEQAISTNQPVVALESTIVAHGMPYPQNYQVAMEVESIVRSKVGCNYIPSLRRFLLLGCEVIFFKVIYSLS